MTWRSAVSVGVMVVVVAWLSTVDLPSVPSARGAKARATRGAGLTSDFDGDGFEDLAAGVERDDVRDVPLAGTVSVLYGSLGGVSARNQLWSQDSRGIEDAAKEFDEFGWAVATGDFNGDGFADLAVGTPFEEVRGIGNAGAANVLYGSAQGLSAAGNQFWHQDSPGIEGDAEFLDNFGNALTTGDFNGDGYADLAIGVSGEDVFGSGGFVSHGAVNVLYGSPTGLSAAGNQYWHQASPGIKGDPDVGDSFGTALSAGDYNGDGFSDLAVGVPSEGPAAGAMNVLYGSPAGLSASGNQLWDQDSPGIKDVAESDDIFGVDLGSADFNGDGFADVAVGVWHEDVVQFGGDEGAVNVLYGSPSGLTAESNQFWHQDSPGIKDTAEVNDSFGFSLSAADYNGDGFADLAVGVPGESLETVPYPGVGAVNVLYGSASGLAARGNQFWHQNRPGIKDEAEGGDAFARRLGSGDYNNDGFRDLVVGVPFEDTELSEAGALHVLYGSADGLTAAGNQFWHRNSRGIKGKAQEGAWFASSLSGP